jgi:hypothetical protein
MFTTGYLTNFFDFEFNLLAVPLHEAATATCTKLPELICCPQVTCAGSGAVLSYI